ncbi:hypothetical protein HZY97_10065 [Sphingomonas sp. R-74633]|uniref:hypothetical protein n=1 Tax=Sphingomonas sp. R-74633 TaxID=2751188 RepID=UPI0015D346BF|nr:hypothetical protein [Sphingomonas sp. R-74633]NYT41101.1 hypothetical protein [Sphingomonas sp. R-74633]
MAYLDSQSGLLEGLAGSVPSEAMLTPLELRTLQLSQADGRASLRAPNRIERLGAMLFGSRRVAGLANPRLEALRRFAILYRLDGAAIDAAEMMRAEAAGLSAGMLDRVRRIVDGWPRHAGPLLRAASLLVAVALATTAGLTLYFWLADELDRPVAAILLGAIAVTLAPIFARGSRG